MTGFPVALVNSSWIETLRSQPMHVLVQPGEESAELAGSNLFLDLRALRVQRIPELRGNEGAERVGREVSERTYRPVDVLQAPFRVTGWTDPQALFHEIVPGLGDAANGELAAEDALLQVVAQHDVQRIGELIGIHADQAAAHAVEVPVEILQAPFGPAHAEVFFEQRLYVAHEAAATPDDHLEQERLAFFERHAAIASHRLIAPVLRQAEVIHGVAAFVQRAEQARERIVLIEARGDPDIARHALGEGMLALIEAPAIEGKAERLHHLDDQLPLARDGEFAGERLQRVIGLQLDHLVDQARELARQRLEQRVDLLRGDARAELVDQRVVGLQGERLSEECSLVSHQRDDFFQVRREQREVVLLPRLQPLHLGARRGPRQPGNQRLRRRDRMIALTAHLAQVRELPVFEPLGVGLRAIEQARDLGRREQGVVFGFERGQLLAAHFGAAAGHHHRRVPAQQRERAAKGMQAAKFLLELLIRCRGHDSCFRSAASAPQGHLRTAPKTIKRERRERTGWREILAEPHAGNPLLGRSILINQHIT